MNVIGEMVKVMDSNDPTQKGITGEVVLETANTLLVRTGARTLTLEKSGTVLLLQKSNRVLAGDDFAGKLEDRLRSARR